MEEQLDFLPLLLVLLLAFIVPLALARLRWLPVVVGEIVAGILIGRSGLGLVHETATLAVMSNIGLAFLMFLAGMEIDFNRLFPPRSGPQGNGRAGNGPNMLLLALGAYLATLALAIPGGLLLNRLGVQGNYWLLGFILSATSLGVLLPLLKQRGMMATPAGQAIFYSALLADFLTVILLTVFIITYERGLDLQVFSVILLFAAFVLFYRVGFRFFRLPAVRSVIEELSHVTVQIKIRGAIFVLLAFVVLAEYLGLELILGAFLAGMMISLLKAPDDEDLVHKLEAFGFGFFIPVFFILVGVNLDLRALLDSPRSLALLPVFLLVSVLVKGLPALLFRRALSWRETLAGAVLLDTHLSLEIAVAVIGVRLGLLSPAGNVTVILFAVITVLLMPVAFNAILPPARTAPPQRWMVIYGAEDLGVQVAHRLRGHGEAVLLLDSDPRLVAKAEGAGFRARLAESLTQSIAEAAQQPVQAFLALTSEDTRNLLACSAAARYGIEHIVAFVNDPTHLPDFNALGVRVFAPALNRPALLASLARSPDIFDLLTSTSDSQDVREVEVGNPLVSGQPLRTLGLPGGLLVLGVGRDGELIVPHGNTRLEMGDRVTVYGDSEALKEAADWLEGPLPA